MTDEVGLDVGRSALELADEAIDFGAELDTDASRLEGGTTVIDLGVETDGTMDAGLLFAALRRGGLIATEVRIDALGAHTWPYLEATTGHPALARELAASRQVGTWSVSGPGLAGHQDPFAVVTAVGTEPVDEAGASEIADELGVSTDDLYVVTTAPGSIAWSVDAAMSTLETAIDTISATVSECALEVPLPPAVNAPDTAADLADSCRALGARVHLRLSSSLDEPLSSLDGDVPGTLTTVDDQGRVETIGERDLVQLATQFTE